MRIIFDAPTRQYIVQTEKPGETLVLSNLAGKKRMIRNPDKLFNGFDADRPTYRIPEVFWDYIDLCANNSHPMFEQYRTSEPLKQDIPMLDASSCSVAVDDYQLQGAYWLAEKPGRLIGDEMGLGKTVQVLLAYDIHRQLGYKHKLLVFCPKIVIRTWEEEFRRHLGREPEGELFAINYDQLIASGYSRISKWLESVPEEQMWINIDEIHNLAGASSKKFQRLEAMLRNRKYWLSATTGSFIRNRVMSFYGPYKLLTGAEIDIKDFEKHFWNGAYRSAKRVDKLHKVFNIIGIRRRKKDVNISQPRNIITPISVDMTGRQRTMYEELKSKFNLASAICHSQKNTHNMHSILGLFQQQLSIAAHPCIQEKYEDFPDNEVAKFQALDELLETADEEKIVVWSAHPKILERICNRYPERNPVMIPGGLSKTKQTARIDKFMHDPECTLICLSLGACNQGLDGLQYASSTAIYFDISWKPTEFVQSMARIARRGQTQITNQYFLVYRNSIDEQVFNAIMDKINLQERILSGKESDIEMGMDWKSTEEVIDWIMEIM